ncbi:v-SNARE family protein, partial [Reticulomyxa filosa]
WQQIKKATDTSMNRHQRRIKIENSKGKLLNNATTTKAQLSRADELTSLQASHGIVDSALEALSNVKSDLFDQKSLLKQTRKKILDLGNLVGFSNSLVGVIMKRTTEDQWILYGGMLFTIVVIFLLWYFFM